MHVMTIVAGEQQDMRCKMVSAQVLNSRNDLVRALGHAASTR
jgi:hypothetical protein